MSVGDDPGELSHEVLIALRRIIRAIDIHSRRLSKDFGLTGPQLLLLNEMAADGRMLIGELARKAHLSQATVTIIIDRLEDRCLVGRERDERDKRRVWVSLTEKGKRVLAEGPQLLQDTFLANFGSLDLEERQSILAALQSTALMMDAGNLPASPILSVEPLPEPGKSDHKQTP